MSHVILVSSSFLDNIVVKLLDRGSVINGAYPVWFQITDTQIRYFFFFFKTLYFSFLIFIYLHSKLKKMHFHTCAIVKMVQSLNSIPFQNPRGSICIQGQRTGNIVYLKKKKKIKKKKFIVLSEQISHLLNI